MLQSADFRAVPSSDPIRPIWFIPNRILRVPAMRVLAAEAGHPARMRRKGSWMLDAKPGVPNSLLQETGSFGGPARSTQPFPFSK
jgi:hypothetical protein